MYIGLRASDTLIRNPAAYIGSGLCRTSENEGKANFGEFTFYEVGWIELAKLWHKRFRWGHEDCTKAAVACPMPPGGPLPALVPPECQRSREERVDLAEDGFPAALHD